MVVQPILCTFVAGMQPSQVFSQHGPLILSGIPSECQLVKQIKPKVLSGLIWVHSQVFFGQFRQPILSHVPNGKKYVFYQFQRDNSQFREQKKLSPFCDILAAQCHCKL